VRPYKNQKHSFRYPHDGPEAVEQRLSAGEWPFQVRNLQDQGGAAFPADGVDFAPNICGHPFGDQHQADLWIGPALGQQVPGFSRSVRGGPGNPGDCEGQQGAGIGDDEKALVFDGLTPVVSDQ
jgi:hypothetical protein